MIVTSWNIYSCCSWSSEFCSASWQILTISKSVNSTECEKDCCCHLHQWQLASPWDPMQAFHANKDFSEGKYDKLTSVGTVHGKCVRALSKTNHSPEWHSAWSCRGCCCNTLWNWFHEMNHDLISSTKTRWLVPWKEHQDRNSHKMYHPISAITKLFLRISQKAVLKGYPNSS